MSGAEKKVAVVLVVVLIAAVGLYVVTGKSAQSAPANPMAAAMPGGTQTAAASSDPNCATGGKGSESAPTEELGKAGAKLEIVAIVPVAHGCHATSIAELKKAYQAHPNDIHLTVVDAFGPEAKKYAEKAGGITWTVIAINGKSEFDLKGKKLVLQRQEGMSYSPTDLVPIVEQELTKPAKAT